MSLLVEPMVFVTQPGMSDVEFLEFAPECKAELINGEFIMSSPASESHEQLFTFLMTVLNLYVSKHDLGVVRGSRTAVRLGIPGEVYEPDLCFIRRERLGLLMPTYVDGPPDLVVEILSRSTQHDDRVVKKAVYEQAGVPEYWVLHPDRPVAEFYRLIGTSYALIAADEVGIYRSEAVRGFWLKLAWLWPERGEPDPLAALRELGVF